jgi:hypothetical protein
MTEDLSVQKSFFLVASRLLARKQLRNCNKLVVLGAIECGIT